MPSLHPGYAYDIFISYRQKDNKGDRWVTEFVQALKTELEATIKEDVSIYFDQNPHDGLLESHHVDKSLEGKLKCLIFIPILSQTYCDPKSFAWQHEFCAFNRAAQGDSLGRDIRLRNGNVASRILPVRIHDLDAQDQAMVEQETGSALRAIDFIYKEPGVNRPLKPTDSRDLNQNKTDYRNQVNKVANAVKELTEGIRNPQAPPSSTSTTSSHSQKRNTRLPVAIALLLFAILAGYFLYHSLSSGTKKPTGTSLAVLPFENLSADSEQEYFSDGLTEDVIHRLTGLRQLRVISRTSVMSFKKSGKKIPEIARELGVAYVLEGTVRKDGENLLVTVQLIDGATDEHVWSQTLRRKQTELFELQASIAEQIARYLDITITERDLAVLQRIPSTSIEAYDWFLRARESQLMGRLSDYVNADRLLRRAIAEDANFLEAISLLAFNTFSRAHLGQPDVALYDSVGYWAERARRISPDSPEAYMAQGYWYLGENYDWPSALVYFKKANKTNASVANRQIGVGMAGLNQLDSALYYLNRAKRYEPLDPKVYVNKGVLFYRIGVSDSTVAMFQKVRQLDPRHPELMLLYVLNSTQKTDINSQIQEIQLALESEKDPYFIQFTNRILGRFYAVKKDWQKAKEYLLKWEEAPAWPLDEIDSVVHRIVDYQLGHPEGVENYLARMAKPPESTPPNVAVNLAALYQMKSNDDLATRYMDRAAESLTSADNFLEEIRMVLPYWSEINPGPITQRKLAEQTNWRKTMLTAVKKVNGW